MPFSILECPGGVVSAEDIGGHSLPAPSCVRAAVLALHTEGIHEPGQSPPGEEVRRGERRGWREGHSYQGHS